MGVKIREPIATATTSGLVPVPPNNTTTFLRGDATFAAPAAATVPIAVFSLPIHVTTGVQSAVTGGGTLTSADSTGMRIDTSATATSSIDIRNDNGTTTFTGNNYFGSWFAANINGTDFKLFAGFGNVTVTGSDITYLGNHYGFKKVSAASVITASATNAEGTTETATTYTDADGIFVAHKTGTTNIKYYVNRTLQATHTTNIPTTAPTYNMRFAISNVGIAANTAYSIRSGSLTWEGL